MWEVSSSCCAGLPSMSRQHVSQEEHAALAVDQGTELAGGLPQVAEQLAKAVKQVADAEAEAARRGALLRAAEELQGARAECAWLAAYDADDARYKAGHPLWRLLRYLVALPLPPPALALSHVLPWQDMLSQRGLSGTVTTSHLLGDRCPQVCVPDLTGHANAWTRQRVPLTICQRSCNPCAAAHGVVW